MTRMLIVTTGLIWNATDQDHTTRQNMLHGDERAAENYVKFSRDWMKDLKIFKFSEEEVWHEARHLGCEQAHAINSLVALELKLDD